MAQIMADPPIRLTKKNRLWARHLARYWQDPGGQSTPVTWRNWAVITCMVQWALLAISWSTVSVHIKDEYPLGITVWHTLHMNARLFTTEDMISPCHYCSVGRCEVGALFMTYTHLHRVIRKCSRSTGMCITIQILETHMHWSCLTKFAPIGRWQPLHHGTITCMQCMWGIQQLLLLLLFLFLPPYLLLFPWPCVVDCIDQGTAAATM